MVFGTLHVLSIVFGVAYFSTGFIGSILHLGCIALWILLMVEAYQGERLHLPVVGELAEEWVKKINN